MGIAILLLIPALADNRLAVALREGRGEGDASVDKSADGSIPRRY
jgi:hypothetical protein